MLTKDEKESLKLAIVQLEQAINAEQRWEAIACIDNAIESIGEVGEE